MKLDSCQILKSFGVAALLFSLSSAGAQDYDVAAYVWPAYQPEPRWAELGIFKDGKGEWQNVWEAVPKWAGHEQPRKPLWGYENEADPKVVEKKIDAAVSHGVNVFIYDWYWYGGRPFLEDALDKGFLGAPNNGKMKFFIMWANHDVDRTWDNTVSDKKGDGFLWFSALKGEAFKAVADRWVAKYFSRPNYYRIGGKPVLMVYAVGTMIHGFGGMDETVAGLEYLREACRKAGLGGLHLMVCDMGMNAERVRRLGVDSVTPYQLLQYAAADDEPDYADWAARAQRRFAEGLQELAVKGYFAHSSVGWDRNPRFPASVKDPVVRDSTPEKFAVTLRRARDWADAHTPEGWPRLVTLNSWNEWTEGSYLEPDLKWGFGYLEAVRRVFVVEPAQKAASQIKPEKGENQ